MLPKEVTYNTASPAPAPCELLSGWDCWLCCSVLPHVDASSSISCAHTRCRSSGMHEIYMVHAQHLATPECKTTTLCRSVQAEEHSIWSACKAAEPIECETTTLCRSVQAEEHSIWSAFRAFVIVNAFKSNQKKSNLDRFSAKATLCS